MPKDLAWEETLSSRTNKITDERGVLAELDAQLAMRKIAGSNYIIRVSISE